MRKDIASRPVVGDDDGVTRWRRWAVALITLAAGATAIIFALRSPDGLESATKVGALIVGLAPLTVGLVVWAHRRPPTVPAASTVEQVDAARRELAEQVLSQWRNEITVRQLDDLGLLAVRWRESFAIVLVDGWNTATGINDRGVVCGVSGKNSGSNMHAVLWNRWQSTHPTR